MSLEGRKLGKYRLERKLGSGGMGEVYLAEHEMLQSRVAVKVLPAEFSRDPQMVERFLREARSAAALRHPHIIRIHDVGAEGDINYIAMDLIEGISLTQRIASTGGMDPDGIVRVSRQVLSALALAHQAGIVHRDIKPDNVLLDTRGDAVVMDFGIAKAKSGTRLTAVGSFLGTLHYASPEQAKGLEVDARSDLYSWGVVMYEMATGRTPFTAQETSALLYQHVHEVPEPPNRLAPGLPAGLAAFVLRLLEKDPARRYASAEQALADLDRLTGNTTGPRPAMGAAQATRMEGRSGHQTQAKALFKEARQLADKGGWAAAAVLAEKAQSLDPDSVPVQELVEEVRKESKREDEIATLTAQAEALLGEGLYQDASQVITQLAGVSRDKKATLDWLEKVLEQAKVAAALEAELQKGRALEAAGELEAAAHLYATLGRDHGKHPLLKQAAGRVEALLKARELVRQSQKAAQAGDLAQGVELAQQAVDLVPEHQPARELLEQLRHRQSQSQRAQALMDQARELLANDPATALDLLSEAHGLAPDLPDLEQWLEQAREAAAQAPPPPAPPAAAPPPPPRDATRVAVASEILAPPPKPPAPPAPPASPGATPPPPAQPPREHLATRVEPQAPKPEVAPPQPDTAPEAPAASGGTKGAAMAVGAAVLLTVLGVGWWFMSRPATPPAPTVAQETTTPQTAPAPQADHAAQLAQARQDLAAGRLDQAQETFQQILQQSPGQAEALQGLEQVRAARGQDQRQEAQKLFDQGRERLSADDLDGAEGKFKAAAQLSPDLPGVSEGLTQVAKRRQVLAQQQAAAQQAQQARDQAAQQLAQGQTDLAAGRLDLAQTAFQRALALDPTLTQAQQGLDQVAAQRQAAQNRDQAATLLAQGQAAQTAGRLEEAQTAYRQALALDPTLTQAQQGLDQVSQDLARQSQGNQAQALLTQGREHLANGQFAQAREAFNQALSLDPTLTQAQAGLDQVTAHEKAQAQRQASRQQAEQLLVDGQALLSAGRLDEAQKAYQRALDLDPELTQAKQGLEQVAARRQAASKTTTDQTQTETADKTKSGGSVMPTPEELANQQALNQGIEAYKAGDYPRAVTLLERYVAAYPNSQVGIDTLAMARKMAATSQVGTITVGCQPVAEVYLDGRKVGVTPFIIQNVPVGTRTVEVRAYGGSEAKTLEVAPRTAYKLKFRLSGGQLAVNAAPWAEVYLDGQDMGQTPLVLKGLPLGPHRLELKREGFQPHAQEVVLEKNKALSVRQRLSPQ